MKYTWSAVGTKSNSSDAASKVTGFTVWVFAIRALRSASSGPPMSPVMLSELFGPTTSAMLPEDRMIPSLKETTAGSSTWIEPAWAGAPE
ncbi:MAG: hypothetical protein R2746_15095 [Acidimicrobiales bacterium]